MQKDAAVTPELFFETATAYQRSAALKAAVELDIFSAIGSGNRTPAAISAATSASERGVRILCDALTIIGLLNKNGSGYDLTDSSAFFLDKKSPAYIGSVVNFLNSPMIVRGFDGLTEAVRQGGTTVGDQSSVDPESPMWETFARAMVPMMFPAAQEIASLAGYETDRPLKVLDVAAGHGIFGIMFAQRHPNAEIFALDWANVLPVARENAGKFGVEDRFHTIEGSAFDVDLGNDYDVVLVANFLHHFDAETCERFLKRVNTATKDDGKVLTLEFVPNDDRVTPPMEASFSLVMLAGTPGGDAYTFAELRSMFENAGFSRNENIALTASPQHLVISAK